MFTKLRNRFSKNKPPVVRVTVGMRYRFLSETSNITGTVKSISVQRVGDNNVTMKFSLVDVTGAYHQGKD